MTNNKLYMEIVGTSKKKCIVAYWNIQSYVCVFWPKVFWDLGSY